MSVEVEISMTVMSMLCAITYWEHTTVPARRVMLGMGYTAA